MPTKGNNGNKLSSLLSKANDLSDAAAKNTMTAAKAVGSITKDVAISVGGKTKGVVSVVGVLAKEASQEASKKLGISINDSQFLSKAKAVSDTTAENMTVMARVAGGLTKEVAVSVSEKTKEIAATVGVLAKEASQETSKKIVNSISDTKARIEEMKAAKVAAKEAADENKRAQNQVKNQVKLDQALKDALDAYNTEYTSFSDHGMELYIQRERSIDLIQNIESLINSISNHPKSFDTDIEEIEIHRFEFKGISDYAKEELSVAKKSAAGAGAGVAAGATVASLAPTAAMWIATTFGTASTGTAISALSGAAATKAALAWLGGGAIAAGGGGTAAGSAFLALCGPVGWSIAGVTLLTSIVLFAANKSKLNKQKKEETDAVIRNTMALKEIGSKVDLILEETNALRDNLAELYRESMPLYNGAYISMSEESKTRLGTIVNNTKSLAALLCKTV